MINLSLWQQTWWIKSRGHRYCAPVRQPSLFLTPRWDAPCCSPWAGHVVIVPEDWGEKKCVVPLNLRRAETCRLKLGARQRKEKGGREREIDYGEVSRVNMENFFFPLIRDQWVKVSFSLYFYLNTFVLLTFTLIIYRIKMLKALQIKSWYLQLYI